MAKFLCRGGVEMTTTVELTTAQKIQLQKETGVVADELLFSLASELSEKEYLQLGEDVFIVLGKTWSQSHR